MADIRVLVSGSGKMGQQVGEAVMAADGMEAVGYVDALAADNVLGELPVYRDAAAAIIEAQPDVIVDFTNLAWTPILAEAALPARVPLVIGTTGLSPELIDWIDRTCRDYRVGAFVAPNFALGAVLMMHFARQAARFFDTAEIIELHHNQKVDAPSGTAKSTAEQMVAARGRPFDHAPTEKEIIPGTRGGQLGGIAIHSVRQPGLVAHQEVIFGSTGQTLLIRHDSTGRDSFMPGVLLAVRAVVGLDHLVVGLDRLLGLES